MDYWLAALPSADEDAVEAHLLTCDECGDRLREAIAMAEGLRALARSGSLQVVVSDQFVTHAAETGLRVREYAPPRGEAVQCTVAADDDLLVARLAVDLATASRVDLSWCDPRGIEHQRMADIPIRAEARQRHLPAVHHVGQGLAHGDDDRAAPSGRRKRGRNGFSASTRSTTRERFLARPAGSCPEPRRNEASAVLETPRHR